jgi:hypothetical protein
MPVGEARTTAARQVAARWGSVGLAAAILVSQADPSGNRAAVVEEINGVAPAGARLKPNSLKTLLKPQAAGALKDLVKRAQKPGNVRFDRLSGESRLSPVLARKRVH